MPARERIQRAYSKAREIGFDNGSKLVLMSDIHRGTGGGADNFSKNQNLFYVALNYYYREGFTYFELGDGDELWENRSFARIAREYGHIFELMTKFHKEGRLHMLYGNHDMAKSSAKWRGGKSAGPDWDSIFPDIEVAESLLLRRKETGGELLLLHGHQADFFNFCMWKLAKFLVRYVWMPLDALGLEDPGEASSNPARREKVESELAAWCESAGTAIIAGHTHRAAFPENGGPGYYNDGSCVHRRYITGLELAGGKISMVKWSVQPRDDNVLYVRRDVISGPKDL